MLCNVETPDDGRKSVELTPMKIEGLFGTSAVLAFRKIPDCEAQ